MFDALKSIVDLLRSVLKRIAIIKEKRARHEAILELLGTYFVLVDVIKDGKGLLDSLGDNPAAKLAGLAPEEAQRTADEWAEVARRQAARLYSLGGTLLGHDALAVVDPKLKDRLEQIVGSKFERADSLHGIGAGLVVYSMFGRVEDTAWLLGVIQSMYPARASGILDVTKAREELAVLEHALDEYRKICERLATDKEIVALAKEARKRTKTKGR